MRYDLHVHSTVSDGVFPPAEVVRRARAAGLGGIALTDHDSTAGVEEARAEGERVGLVVLTGCELSAHWRGASVHVVAYLVDPTDPRWDEELRWLREGRAMRAEATVERLRALGVAITIERVREIARGESIGRPHIAQGMIEAGVIGRIEEAFTPEWIGHDGRAHVDKRNLTPQAAVELAHGAGGVAVLAHPIWIDREAHGGDARGLIEELAALGLDGIEVGHPDHDEDARGTFGALADRLGLLKTNSSDWHGNEQGGPLGAYSTGEEVVEALAARRRTGEKR